MKERIVDRLRKKGIRVGNDTRVSKRLKLSPNISIGKNCLIVARHIDSRERIIIGDNVVINSEVWIERGSHDYTKDNWEYIGQELEIEDGVWIATGAKILPGCKKIGRNAILGAFTVIAKDVEEGQIMVGNPAKCIGINKVSRKISIPVFTGSKKPF